MADLSIRFFQPHKALAPYITTYYLTEVDVGEGDRIVDHLHPEWANFRFIRGVVPLAAIGSGPLQETHSFSVTGPTSYACQFSVGNMRAWGVGLMPLGWARFVGVAADLYSDRFVNGMDDPVFAQSKKLADTLSSIEVDIDIELGAIDEHFLGLLQGSVAPIRNMNIETAQKALLDSDVSTVASFSEQLGMSPRSVERFSRRVFGFPPKLLIRRQRFLRSLSQFMLDPTMRWMQTLDTHYVDQSHFARDFDRFMGMSAREYANLDHPILGAAAFARMAAAGAAMQALHVQTN